MIMLIKGENGFRRANHRKTIETFSMRNYLDRMPNLKHFEFCSTVLWVKKVKELLETYERIGGNPEKLIEKYKTHKAMQIYLDNKDKC